MADDAVHRDPHAVVDFYSRVAWIYEGWGRIVDSRVRERVRTIVAEGAGGTTLEVGCGSGAILVDIAKDNAHGETIGIDLAPGMIRVAQRRMARAGLKRVRVELGDAERIAQDDSSVDVVTSSYVLDILPMQRIVATLAEFHRVLKPGGRVVLANVTPGERRRHKLPELLYGTGLPLTGNCRGILAGPLLEQVGFVDVGREYVSQLSMPSEIVSARKP